METDLTLTRISRNNKPAIRDHDMSVPEILDFLENGAIYRTFADVLSRVYDGDDLKETLTDHLTEISGKKRDSVARNVRNWLNGSSVPQREQLFQICFSLKLDERQSNQILTSASETGIHYRNPDELVYAYCLRAGKTWQETQELRKKLEPIYAAAVKKNRKAARKTATATRKIYTVQLRRDFNELVTTDNELELFLQEHLNDFSVIHETAYEKFIRMLELLQAPEPGAEEKSVHTVVEEYLDMQVPKKSAKGNAGYLQRVIRKNWPSDDVLAKMRARDIDVSRKVLLLLFLLTEEFEVTDPIRPTDGKSGEPPEEDFAFIDDVDEEDAGIRMEIRLNQINLFLDSYGMNRLDPGSPFDCVVLYALKANYGGNDEDGDVMGERLKHVLERLFSEGEPDSEENQSWKKTANHGQPG